MDKSIRVQVKEPCHENWQNMTANEKGRFCASCQKTVVDFTLMNDRQILDHLSKASGSTCGRFANDQLDRELSAEVVKSKSRWAYLLNLLIPVFFTNSGNPTKGEHSIANSNSVERADVSSKNSGVVGMLYTETYYPADTLGTVAISREVCDLQLPPEKGLAEIKIDTIINEEIARDSMVKFIPPVLAFDDTTGIIPDVKLPVPQEEKCSIGILGGIGYKVEVLVDNPIKEFIKDTLVTIGLKKLIKAYPNPVIAGQSVTIDFSPRTLGTYNLDLFDLNGRKLYSRQVNMVFAKQSFQIPTISSWSKGTYIIRISGEGKDNVQNVKVMVR